MQIEVYLFVGASIRCAYSRDTQTGKCACLICKLLEKHPFRVLFDLFFSIAVLLISALERWLYKKGFPYRYMPAVLKRYSGRDVLIILSWVVLEFQR